jgi:hypothetical protein
MAKKRSSQYPLCRHTLTTGRLCQSPAHAESAFCYHHRKLHGARRRITGSGPGLSAHVLHPLRNAEDIQQALAMVLNGIASGRVGYKQGNAMLVALRCASSNL